MKASEFTTEDNFGTHPKRPARTGSRHPRGHQPVPRYKTITAQDSDNTAESVAEGSKEDMSKEVKAMATGTCPHCHGPVKKTEHPTLTQYHCPKCGIRASQDKQGVAEGSYDDDDTSMSEKLDELLQQGMDYKQAVKLVAKTYNTYPEYVVGSYNRWGNHNYEPYDNFGEQGVAEGSDQEENIGGRYDADEFDSMVARLKKLAGSGPMKTVYDPDRRVYRNMPTAQQPTQQPKKAPR
jgi:predicted RNA-binding Zn-ribbon protein involved in translation (DUF1610 family)